MKPDSAPNRNDPCWCGSGEKYKKCHLNYDIEEQLLNRNPQRPQPIPRTQEFLAGMRSSCDLAKATLTMVEQRLRPGVTTEEINRWVHEFTLDHGAIPATLNYHGYPKSCCTSLNEVVCHGIPSPEVVVKEGDLLNVDVTCILNGYFGDTNKSYLIGEVAPETARIAQVAKECLDLGIAAVRPYGHIGDIGFAIQNHAHAQGCSVVEQFVGHGIGKKFHEEPQVPHFGRSGSGTLILPGMFFTIEPMINLGRKAVKILGDNWTAVTVDGKLSAQYEHTLYVSETGVEVLTA
ncbi:MAG: type I methionyl aminopeptidase [Candidatus Lambdaproteobacteria bacterium RIFOXYD1_FULL_56_27]|uniref:Methionine aminopeptidase n=1 Tax=Candidatus Lambdaproteobacteria bacterium RIFOXYD2_FULL_56_26 TaxID=1817773 RepID=A0A1F6GR66_9PROT|nr:MAG: type I methionyl aminopeptidase [Candidatus Lambdaproteobacteria bacterium RIFOXYC1_FULL_56_13]OGH00655.1 MAG: type I methionyl aminopeptidase [Candidatus Lambdaproteobacteria bacterium RIFOXYD2_FULL_56_26]OGH07822.1 MAG: type I methionyl aminopeptidase [Candidatus Lambdaproteobacteria bacterium RIFOXYD1_FULL_56_27]